MNDTERVASIDRDAELVLLARLLDERTRPVPPPPNRVRYDPTLRHQLVELMTMLAGAYGPETRGGNTRPHLQRIA